MDFQEFDGSLDVFVSLVDGVFELLLSVDESGVLVSEVSGHLGPVGGLSFFLFLDGCCGGWRYQKDVSGFDELLPELGKECGDLLEGLVVDVGGQLSEGAD